MPKCCVSLFLTSVVVCSGCGRSVTVETREGEEVTAERQGESVVIQGAGANEGEKVTVDEKAETVVVQGADGKRIAVGGAVTELPPGFPAEDIPPYADAEILATVDSPHAKSVTFRTADSPDKVKESYSAQLQQEGWSVQTTLNVGGRTMIHFTKDDRALALVVGVDEGASATTVNLAVTQKNAPKK